MPKPEDDPTGKRPYKKIKIEEAVGMSIPHDMTEIIPGKFKGPSFHRGQKIETGDLCHLMRLGKRHIYVLELGKDEVHEDEAVLELAEALSGPGVTYTPNPSEGKIQLFAQTDGLFTVKVDPLISLNEIQDVMCASIHTHTPVKKGQKLAGTRAVPLVIQRPVLDQALELAKHHFPIFSVKPFIMHKVYLIITGNEVYQGLIVDRFEVIVRNKVTELGSILMETVILPDDEEAIAHHLNRFLSQGADLIVTTGGMSVDPDDVTRIGIYQAGVDRMYYSSAVLPGAMFLLAYRGDIPIMGIPACALYHKATIFDLILPRILAGEKPDAKDLARLAHGGLCLDCPACRYPACPFGKGS